MSSNTIRTEVRGLDVTLDEISLTISRAGEDLIVPVTLSPEEVGRLRLEMAKALLPEWNQLEDIKKRGTERNRRYLASWLVMCVAAFTAFVSYPQYVPCLLLSVLSLFLWWRAGFMDQKAEREAQAARNAFRPDWFYVQERLLESDEPQPGS